MFPAGEREIIQYHNGVPILPEARSQYKAFTQFKHGSSDSPPYYGKFKIPQGAAGCLQNCKFVISGTLRSLTREQAVDLINTYGGMVASSISKQTNYLIRGCVQVGQKKLDEAARKRIPITDEEGLFQFLKLSNPDYVEEEEVQEEEDDEENAYLSETNFPISDLWTEKYRPRKVKHIVGNQGSIDQLDQFLKNFNSELHQNNYVVIDGPNGCGKSTAAHLIPYLNGFRPIDFNASDNRSASFIKEEISTLFTNMGLSITGEFEKICLIFDEIDGMVSSDHSAYQELWKHVRNTEIPVICICNKRDDQKMASLLRKAVVIEF